MVADANQAHKLLIQSPYYQHLIAAHSKFKKLLELFSGYAVYPLVKE